MASRFYDYPRQSIDKIANAPPLYVAFTEDCRLTLTFVKSVWMSALDSKEFYVEAFDDMVGWRWD